MAKASLGKLDTRQPVTADLTKVRDITARMNTPAAPPQMSADFITPINVPQPKAWRPNALAVLDGVLGGGMTFTESRRAEEDRHRAELAMPQMEALKSRLLTELGKAGPDELKAYLTNPGEYGKNMATRVAAANVAGGDSRVYGNPEQGGAVFTAPKYQIEDGAGVKLGPEGMSVLGRLPRKPEFQVLKPGDNLFRLPSDGAPDAPALAPASAPAGSLDPDAVWRAAIQQESGGRPGVIGPNTPYGNAQGLTQMLPATAASMAQKLGVAWRPELMTAATPEAAAYQEQLGRAYFDEGMAKYGGDPRKALAYYHGGPDERIWGPKTAAHVNAVMARLGGSEGAPLMGGPAGDQLQAPSGMQPIASGGPVQPNIPTGYRLAANGNLEFIPGGPADPAQKAMTLKFVPAKIQEGYVGNSSAIRQIDEAIAAINSRPQSLGLPRMAGENINQRFDPDGVEARAAVANIGSLLIHDRSGAAVTAAEAPRLMPFIPRVTDTPEAAVKKLSALRQQYQNANAEIDVSYGEDRGYRAPGAAPAKAAPVTGRALAPAIYATRNRLRESGRLDPSQPAGSERNPFVARDQSVVDGLEKRFPGQKIYVITPEGLGVLE